LNNPKYSNINNYKVEDDKCEDDDKLEDDEEEAEFESSDDNTNLGMLSLSGSIG
jgi:hypothetical protein